MSALVLVACPRPAVIAAATPGESAPSTLLPADAAVVAVLQPAPTLQQAVRAVLSAADRPGGLLEGAGERLERSLGVDPLSKLTLALSGLDAGKELTVALRPSGEPLVVVPVGSPRRFDEALKRVFGRDGGVSAARGRSVVWRGQGGEVRAVVRTFGARAVLALAPDDPLATAALLDHLDTPGFALDDDRGFPVGLSTPPSSADGEVFTAWTTGVDVLGPDALGVLDAVPLGRGPFVLRAAVVDGALHLTARAPSAEGSATATWTRPPGSCALDAAAMMWVEAPAAWLPDELADGRARLSGQVALGLLAFAKRPDAAPPDPGTDPLALGHLVVLGVPSSTEAQADLVASFSGALDGVQPSRREVGAFEVFELPGPPSAPWRRLTAVVSPSLFALFSGPFPPPVPGGAGGPQDEPRPSGEDGGLEALLRTLGRPCASTPSRASLSLAAGPLHERLPDVVGARAEPGADTEAGATVALLRLLARSLVGVERLGVEVRSLPGVLVLDATLELAR